MEKFCYNDEFYDDLLELIEDLEIEDEIPDYPDDYKIEVEECVLEPLAIFTPDYIIERINEERFSENNVDDEYNKVCEALKKYVDFEKLNAAIPKLWYPKPYKKHRFTKKDLLEAIT